ncbi:hypothetical protein LOTGIDRAFT_237578 [Lottia gigantea]|uniref:Uncharacterized protein n=1 Tax=Lottia gigantea TaxID=225164 RepID=V4B0L2_LOTGI|nr:hypothetical protein LOTGIDRAFT_237578 [Lottia gigantea]ESP03678.1 hypothetical protein LOTGIDRAFT_237578 [Lottia gigantea]
MAESQLLREPSTSFLGDDNIEKHEEDLEQQALDEILKETKRSAERAKELGAFGWTKSKIPPTNKTFLKNMLVSTLRNIDSPKHSGHRARGRENHKDYYDARKHRGAYRDDSRDYKDSFYTGKYIYKTRSRDREHYHRDRQNSRDREHSHDREQSKDRAEKNSKRRQRKEKKSKKEGKTSEKHKNKHSKSKKSKKKHKSKKKESKEES